MGSRTKKYVPLGSYNLFEGKQFASCEMFFCWPFLMLEHITCFTRDTVVSWSDTRGKGFAVVEQAAAIPVFKASLVAVWRGVVFLDEGCVDK